VIFSVISLSSDRRRHWLCYFNIATPLTSSLASAKFFWRDGKILIELLAVLDENFGGLFMVTDPRQNPWCSTGRIFLAQATP
jgi:hypothetical protein